MRETKGVFFSQSACQECLRLFRAHFHCIRGTHGVDTHTTIHTFNLTRSLRKNHAGQVAEQHAIAGLGFPLARHPVRDGVRRVPQTLERQPMDTIVIPRHSVRATRARDTALAHLDTRDTTLISSHQKREKTLRNGSRLVLAPAVVEPRHKRLALARAHHRARRVQQRRVLRPRRPPLRRRHAVARRRPRTTSHQATRHAPIFSPS